MIVQSAIASMVGLMPSSMDVRFEAIVDMKEPVPPEPARFSDDTIFPQLYRHITSKLRNFMNLIGASVAHQLGSEGSLIICRLDRTGHS